MRQYDVDTAFLNGVLKDVYISQGVDMDPSQVLKLNKSMYGLKQAAPTWFKTISNVFRNMEFCAMCYRPVRFCSSRWTPFVDLRDAECRRYAAKSTSDSLIDKVADELASRFKLETLGNVIFILGIEVKYAQETRSIRSAKVRALTEWSSNLIKLDQKRSTTNMFKDKSCLSAR